MTKEEQIAKLKRELGRAESEATRIRREIQSLKTPSLAQRARRHEISELVNEKMRSSGLDYRSAFNAVQADRPELFTNADQ